MFPTMHMCVALSNLIMSIEINETKNRELIKKVSLRFRFIDGGI